MLGIGVGIPVSCIGMMTLGSTVDNILLEDGGNLVVETGDGTIELE